MTRGNVRWDVQRESDEDNVQRRFMVGASGLNDGGEERRLLLVDILIQDTIFLQPTERKLS